MNWKLWRAIKFNGKTYVFRNGALLDGWTEKFQVAGGLPIGERLAELLNANQ